MPQAVITVCLGVLSSALFNVLCFFFSDDLTSFYSNYWGLVIAISVLFIVATCTTGCIVARGQKERIKNLKEENSLLRSDLDKLNAEFKNLNNLTDAMKFHRAAIAVEEDS